MSSLSQREQVLFDLLQDEKSRQIFIACKAFAEGNAKRRTVFKDLIERPEGFESLMSRLSQNKYIIWGAGSVCKKLIDVFSYFDADKNCIEIWDKNPKLQGREIFGIPVVAPKNTLNDADRQRLYLIGLSEKMRKEQCAEIYSSLVNLGVPVDNILRPYWKVHNEWSYFDKDIVVKNLGQDEIFIDGGSYDFYTSNAFVKVCDDAGATVKRIYAFEPSDEYGELCRKNAVYLGDKAKVINAGLYSSDTTLYFEMNSSNTGGLIVTERNADNNMPLAVVALDNCVDINDKVTFIKYDVEGAELEALKGAANTIRRDTPNLAICIYHKPLDYIEIFEYIHSLVPDYKFYIRIYGAGGGDIVLHAVKKRPTVNDNTPKDYNDD